MINVALTGNIAAGKSAVAELFGRWGATVIDADHLVRQLQAPGSPVLAAITQAFGPQVIRMDGTLDRALVRARVLADREKRCALEGIVHPAVQARRAVLVEEARQRGDRIVVNDIPLLFEALDPGAFDAVVLVDAPEEVRVARLVNQRCLAEGEARQLVAAQLPSADKRAWRGGTPVKGPFIIDNDADRSALEARARVVWERLEALVRP